jgi:hypothetical protein
VGWVREGGQHAAVIAPEAVAIKGKRAAHACEDIVARIHLAAAVARAITFSGNFSTFSDSICSAVKKTSEKSDAGQRSENPTAAQHPIFPTNSKKNIEQSCWAD